MEQFVQEIMPAVLQLIATVVLGLIGWAVPKVKRYFDDKGITETIAQYDYLADIAVKAVQQIYWNEDGATKKAKAKDFIIDSLDDLGLDITQTQLDMFIESAVKRAKDEWVEIEVEPTITVDGNSGKVTHGTLDVSDVSVINEADK